MITTVELKTRHFMAVICMGMGMEMSTQLNTTQPLPWSQSNVIHRVLVWSMNLVIIVPVAGLAPSGAWPSAGTLTTADLDRIFCFKCCWLFMIQIMFSLIGFNHVEGRWSRSQNIMAYPELTMCRFCPFPLYLVTTHSLVGVAGWILRR